MLADSALDAWGTVLDAIEMDIAAAMSGEAPQSWKPPADLGPIPAELLERARLVLGAQAEAAALIGISNAETTKHLQAIASIPEPHERPRLAFLDVTG